MNFVSIECWIHAMNDFAAIITVVVHFTVHACIKSLLLASGSQSCCILPGLWLLKLLHTSWSCMHWDQTVLPPFDHSPSVSGEKAIQVLQLPD